MLFDMFYDSTYVAYFTDNDIQLPFTQLEIAACADAYLEDDKVFLTWRSADPHHDHCEDARLIAKAIGVWLHCGVDEVGMVNVQQTGSLDTSDIELIVKAKSGINPDL